MNSNVAYCTFATYFYVSRFFGLKLKQKQFRAENCSASAFLGKHKNLFKKTNAMQLPQFEYGKTP